LSCTHPYIRGFACLRYINPRLIDLLIDYSLISYCDLSMAIQYSSESIMWWKAIQRIFGLLPWQTIFMHCRVLGSNIIDSCSRILIGSRRKMSSTLFESWVCCTSACCNVLVTTAGVGYCNALVSICNCWAVTPQNHLQSLSGIATCFYCIVLLYHSLYFDCITVRFVPLHYATCIGLGYWAISINSAVQLFSCKYVTIKLS